MREIVLGLDIGGTKLAAGVVGTDGVVLTSAGRATPNRSDTRADEIWYAIAELAADVMSQAGAGRGDLVGVGVGCGGPMLWPEGIVSPLNIPAWREFPLRERFIEWAQGGPVRLHNDAVCFAVAEHWRGAARGADAALGVVVSTGVGGGLVLGGRVLNGRSGNAGHIGHVLVDPDGPLCGCGAHGCLEAVARGPAIVGWAIEHGWHPSRARAAEPTAEDLAADARGGDRVAAAAFARAGRALARALSSTTNVLDLDVVVVGGGVTGAGALLFEPMAAELAGRLTMDFARRMVVRPTALGRDAGVIGAVALVAAGDTYWSAS